MNSNLDFTQEFPVLNHYTYLNTASSGLLPASVVAWREQHDKALLQEASMFRDQHKTHIWEIKETVARFFSTEKERVALVPNFSIGLNILMEGLPKNQKILMIEGDYPSVNWPVEFRDFEVCYADLNENLETNIEAAFAKHRPDVFLCSIVQYITGIKVDLTFLKELKNQYPETLFIADGTQYFGTERFHFSESAFDIVGASSYKWMLGGYGNGFFLLKDGLDKKLFPNTIGFNSADAVFGNRDKINIIGKMELGHQDTLNYGTLAQSIELLEKIGMESVETYLQEFSSWAHERFRALSLLPIEISERKNHSTIFNIKGDEKLLQHLRKNNIIVSARGKGLRISFHFYNKPEEIELLLKNI